MCPTISNVSFVCKVPEISLELPDYLLASYCALYVLFAVDLGYLRRTCRSKCSPDYVFLGNQRGILLFTACYPSRGRSHSEGLAVGL